MNKDEVLKKYVMRCTISSVYNYTQRFSAVTNVVEIFQGDPNEVGEHQKQNNGMCTKNRLVEGVL